MATYIKKHELTTENNFDLAEDMLSYSRHTRAWSAEEYYRERSDMAKKFLGTYEISIDRKSDFQEFKEMLYRASRRYREDEEFKEDIAPEEIQEIADRRRAQYDFYNAFTFEEWKNGKMAQGIKVGKKLLKEKFPQSVIDYYATQVKDERHVYLTITDRVHDIVGMSNFAQSGSWDGYGRTSCQDTRHNVDMNINLFGALGDDNMVIGQLHYNLEDVHDMQNNLKARVSMRAWSVSYNGRKYDILKGVRLYGDQETKNQLEQCLQVLEAEGIGISAETD